MSAADERDRFDAIVVGSGFGGAVTACRLAEAGWRVLVLERGRAWPPGSFARTPREMSHAFWDPPTGEHGYLDIWSFTGMNFVTASGLGGGSLIYANVMLRKPAETFVETETERWPVTRADLDPHYDRVEAVQRPQRYPVDRAPYSRTRKAHAMAEAGNALGLEVEHPPLAVAFSPAAGEDPAPRLPIVEDVPNLHRAGRMTCVLCGECDTGCNYGAKQTLDFTYLSRAVAAGAEIRTLCDARTLAKDGEDWAVGYTQHLEGREPGDDSNLLDHDDENERRTVTAGHVVLSAGTAGTVRLLLTNRIEFPQISNRLGHGISGNGDLLSFVREARAGEQGERDRPWRYLDPSYGPVITTSLRVPAERSRSQTDHYIQDGGAPVFTEWLWQMFEVPEDLWAARRMAVRRLKDKLGGHRDSNLSAEIAGMLGSAHMSAAMTPILGMGRDVAGGRLHLDRDGRLDMTWDAASSDPHFDALRASSKAVADELGAKWMEPHSAHMTTVHPVGGCAMSATSVDGVVDPYGNVHDCPGLHVADGSVMPGPVGPNPSFTIAALADRFADAMIEAGRKP